MTNDEWIKFQDSIPSEQRWIFEQTRAHDDSALTSMLGAVLKALASIEEKQDGAAQQFGALVAKQDLIVEQANADRNDRQQVTKFLERMDARWEAMNTVVVAIRGDVDVLRRDVDDLLQERVGVQAHDGVVGDWMGEHTKADAEVFERIFAQLSVLQADKADTHTLIDAVLARLAELGTGINGRLTQLIDASKAASRAEGREEGRDAERNHPGAG